MGLFRASLPAFAFFVLLGGAAAAGYWFGAARATHDTRTFTCSMHPQVQHEGPGLCPICHMELVPRDAVGSQADAAIAIDPVVVQNMGVRVQAATERELARELRWFGALAVAQPRVRDVTLKFAAVVERLYADRDGMPIQQGAPLFALYAPDLIQAQERLLAAKRSGDATALAAARLRLSRWDVADAQIDAWLQSEQIERTVVWPSPASGIVLQRSAVEGSSLAAGSSPVRLADLSTLWLEAKVPIADLPLVGAGTAAQVHLDGSPDPIRATVLEVLPTIEESLRTGTVRLEVPNPNHTLRPGQFAQIHLRVVIAPKALQIPDEAVLDSGTRHVAYVALGNGRFAARTLQLGARGEGGMVEVRQGVQAGEHVVTSGQFLIDAESRLREGASKFADEHLLGGGALPAAPAVPLDANQQAAVDAVFAKYLAVQTTLAKDQEPGALWSELATAAKAMATALPPSLHTLGTALEQSLATTPSGVKPARTAFEAVSKAAIPLFASARPGPAFGGEVYVMYCSMVPASWLQQGKTLRNPYYGSEMLECGELQQALPTATEAKR